MPPGPPPPYAPGMGDEPVVRVVVADDQRLVRTGFRVLLGDADGIDVVGEAADGVEAVEQAVALEPDVVLMDIRMPRLDGISATRSIVDRTASRVLVLTTFDSDEYVFEALTSGASGFLLKDVPAEHLVAAIRSVARGDALIDPSVTRRLISRFTRAIRPTLETAAAVPDRLSVLTARELEVLRLMAAGLTNAEIAGRLVVEETTVKTHVGRVLGKLDLRDRVQAVVLAYETGLVSPGDGSAPT